MKSNQEDKECKGEDQELLPSDRQKPESVEQVPQNQRKQYDKPLNYMQSKNEEYAYQPQSIDELPQSNLEDLQEQSPEERVQSILQATEELSQQENEVPQSKRTDFEKERPNLHDDNTMYQVAEFDEEEDEKNSQHVELVSVEKQEVKDDLEQNEKSNEDSLRTDSWYEYPDEEGEEVDLLDKEATHDFLGETL